MLHYKPSQINRSDSPKLNQDELITMGITDRQITNLPSTSRAAGEHVPRIDGAVPHDDARHSSTDESDSDFDSDIFDLPLNVVVGTRPQGQGN